MGKDWWVCAYTWEVSLPSITLVRQTEEQTDMTTLKIKFNAETFGCKSMADLQVLFTPDEIVEMVQRYMETQRHAIAYRQRAAVKQKLIKAKLAELGIDPATLGEVAE